MSIPNSSASTPTTETESRKAPRGFIPLMFAALFMVTGICVLLFIGREKARIIGQTLPELDIQPLLFVEKPMTPDDMKGKTVVLHFWGFWCAPCLKEYPHFILVQQKYQADPDVLFASVACSDRNTDTKDQLAFYTKQLFNKNNIPDHPVYCDPAEYSRTQISHLLTKGGFYYPTTVVLDGQGRVVEVWRDSIEVKALENAIEKAKKASTQG